jgi:hypothetical protein
LDAFASTTALSVTWKDCGSNADAKVTSVTPDTIQLGGTTVFNGVGDLTKDITKATYKMTMTGVGGVSLLSSCSGDATVSNSCNIGLGPITVGTSTFGGVKLPQDKGQVALPKIVSVQLKPGRPSFALSTTTTLTLIDGDGAEAFCVQINTKPKDTEEVSVGVGR